MITYVLRQEAAHLSYDVLQTEQFNMSKNQQGVPSRPGIPFNTCPECNEGDLCPRRISGIKDWLMMIAGYKPYRCSQCHARLYRRS